MRNKLFLILTLCMSQSLSGQILAEYAWPQGLEHPYILLQYRPFHLTDSSLITLSHAGNFVHDRFIFIELSLSSLEEKRRWVHDLSTEEFGRVIAYNGSFTIVNDNFYYATIDNHIGDEINPPNKDPRLEIISQLKFHYAPVGISDSVVSKELKKDDYVFCYDKIHSFVHLPDKELFFGFAYIIQEDSLPLFLTEDIDRGFQNVYPAWYLCDYSGEIVDYDIVSDDDHLFTGHFVHYEEEENRIYAVGGTLDRELFPVYNNYTGLLGVFNLGDRQFESIEPYWTDTDTIFRAVTFKWKDHEVLVDGLIGWDEYINPIDSLLDLRKEYNAAGTLSFKGKSKIRQYTYTLDGFDVRYGTNAIPFIDTDTSFLLLRDYPFPLDQSEIDPSHLWLLRMSNQGSVLDTIKIKHTFGGDPDVFTDVKFIGGYVDTATSNFYAWGAYADAISFAQLPPRYYPFVYKIDFNEIMETITFVEESGTTQGDKNSVMVYPTVFNTHISLYNKSDHYGRGDFNLYNEMGQLVLKKEFDIVDNEYYTIREVNGLINGAYFYRLQINDYIQTGKLIRKQ